MGADTKTAAAKQSRLAVMSDTLLRDEAITLLLAGHETTALALSWTWLLLGLSLSQTLSCLAVDRESDDDRAQ